jgi:hypothetical protein
MKINKTSGTKSFFAYLEEMEILFNDIGLTYEINVKDMGINKKKSELVVSWDNSPIAKIKKLLKLHKKTDDTDLLPDLEEFENNTTRLILCATEKNFKECFISMTEGGHDYHINVPYPTEKDIDYFLMSIDERYINLMSEENDI